MARTGVARWRGSWSIPAPIMISTAPICRCTRPESPTRQRRSAAISAPTPKPAPTRRNASPSGWRGEGEFLQLNWIVMAGLVPAIHVLLFGRAKDVDARDEPGHDDDGFPKTNFPDRLALLRA